MPVVTNISKLEVIFRDNLTSGRLYSSYLFYIARVSFALNNILETKFLSLFFSKNLTFQFNSFLQMLRKCFKLFVIFGIEVDCKAFFGT